MEVGVGGHQPVEEHQSMFRARSDRALPRSVHQAGFVPGLPHRAHVGHQVRDHHRRQARHPLVRDRPRPHAAQLTTSDSPTMHEVARR